MFQKSLKFSLFLLLLAATKANAQNVAINADGANPDASAMLDVQSTTSGVLIPRVTKIQRDAITNPATGLLIYQTDNESGFYYYQGVSSGGWVRLSTFAGGTNGLTGGWALNGNSGTGGSAFLGTTDPQDLVFKTQNMEVGRFKVNGNGSILLGRGSSIGTGQRTMVIGVDAKGNGSNNAVAIGYGAEVSLERATSLGSGAKAAGNDAIAIGTSTNATGEKAMAFGSGAKASSNEAVGVGANAEAVSYQSVAFGYNAKANSGSDGSVAIGRNTVITDGMQNAVALGSWAKVSSGEAVAIGASTQAVGSQSVALGKNAKTGESGNGSVAIGFDAQTGFNVQNAVALGKGAVASQSNAIILGNNTAQVGIGTSSPNASAVLDINSSNKGVLVPRMTKGSRSVINSPADGLLIYQTDDTSGFYYYQGTNGWTRLANSSGGGAATGWSVSGNNFSDNNAFIGTISYTDLIFKANNVIVGQLKPGGNGSVIFGPNAISTGQKAMVIGAGAQGTANDVVAIGTNAKAQAQDAIVLGNNATGSQGETIAMGKNSQATGYQSIAIGNGAIGSQGEAIAMGKNAQATANQSVAIGNGAIASKQKSIILGNTSDAQVGIGTSSPVNEVKLDVHGGFKLGAGGTAQKNIISVSQNSWQAVPAEGYFEFTVTLPTSVSSTKASVAVSPAVDMPDGVSIAWARMISTNQVKVRLSNYKSTVSTGFGCDFYITVTEF